MAYKIIVSLRAQKEIENAIDYYSLHSADAPVNFINALLGTYAKLESAPFFRLRYKNVRALKLKMFPTLFILLSTKIKTLSEFFPVFTINAILKKDPDKIHYSFTSYL